MKKIIYLTAIIVFSVILYSCNTDVTPPEDPNNPSDPMAVVDLLHPNTSWESVYDSMMYVSTLIGTEAFVKAGISDFTVDNNKNNLYVKGE